MTEDEKRQQKAMLLLEHQEAEQNLAHLEEKAERLSRRIRGVSEWLSYAAQRNSDLSRDEIWIHGLGVRVEPLKDIEIARSMDFDAAAKLIQEIKDARSTLEQLSKRKQSLGLK